MDGTPTKPIPNTSPEVPATVLSLALDQVMAETLRPVAGGLGAICAFFTLSHLLMLPAEIKTVMVITAGITSLGMLGVYAYLREHTLPARWAHPLAAVLSILMLLNPTMHMIFSQDASQTTYFLLLILGLGSILLSTRWFIALTVIAWAAWGLAFATLPNSGGWVGYAYSMLGASGLTAIVFAARLRTARRLESFRIRDARYKTDLETVLKTTDEAQRSLATSMAVGQSITSILDLNVLLTNVANLIQLRFSYTFVGIFLLDETQQYVVCRAGTGEAGKALVAEGFRMKVGQEGIVGWAAGTCRPIRVDDVLKENRYIPIGENCAIRSMLALPLAMGERLFGVLDVESDKVAAFSDNDVPFLHLLADQVAIAINNASLYEREKASRLLTENLYEVGRILSGTLEVSKILPLILEYLAEIVYYDRAAVLLRSSDGMELEILAARGFPKTNQGNCIPLSPGDVFDEIYRTRLPLSIPDVQIRSDWINMTGMPATRSWLGIPLIHANDVIGMVSLARENLQPYQDDELTLAATFAGQAAIALHNARLYEQITRFNQDLEQLVQQRTDMLQTAYAQLERLDQAKSKFISIASHELRTPITLLKGYTQMLLEDPDVVESNKLLPMIEGMSSGANRLHEIIESMLDVAKIDNQELRLHPTPILIPVLLRFVCEGLLPTLKQRNQELVEEFQATPSIEGDLEALRKVFYHLIINAIKYTPDSGKITLSARTLQPGELGMQDGGVEVIVSDTGIGIDASVTDLIFTKFYQTGEVALHSSGKTKFKGGGPGLGLAIARGIITAHHGLIWADSPGYDEKKCPGSRFHVVLPLAQKHT
jgi:signal transduction histidine kinase/putative methionine-R-sulfoxide reductase with GAF domain